MKNVSQVLARIYAQALFDIAAASGELGRIVDDLSAVREAVLRDRNRFEVCLASLTWWSDGQSRTVCAATAAAASKSTGPLDGRAGEAPPEFTGGAPPDVTPWGGTW